MMTDVRPILYVSRCLEHDHCRFDAQMIRSEIVASLKDLCEVKHSCPEAGIGLGIPRRPVRITMEGEKRRLFQPHTGLDHTEAMEGFISKLLDGLGEVDGIILKSKSPTCGIGDVKIFPSKEALQSAGKGSGFLGAEVVNRFPHSVIDDESRLLNSAIRDHFLVRLFTIARFRAARGERKASALIDFHTRNKILLMAYSQAELAKMGRIVSSQKELGLKEAFSLYRDHLSKAMAKGPKYTSMINALMHCFGYVSKDLKPEERAFFLDSIEMYRDERASLETIRELMRGYIVRFDEDYLLKQTFFAPYPLELSTTCGSGRGREFWK
ncbi:MAG: DUF1722 domain-containing protein [Candidatus Thermoplasmatota archaeon]|nr:DUF1722 domain-containing protein [Candidatus Thermoplasmatota archaeon]